MNPIQQLNAEIQAAEAALFRTTTLKEWDVAIRRYNELKIRWYQQTGDGVILESINKVEFNLHKLRTP